MASETSFDLFVVGAGSGGVRAARVAARLGAKVAVCEEGRLGGTCVNVGCVPKKLYVYGSQVREELEIAADYGWTVTDPRFDIGRWTAGKKAEIARLNRIYGELLEDAGVTLLRGRGRLIDRNTVQVGETAHRAEHLLIATGSRPHRPPVVGGELGITSDEVFDLDALPRRAIITGGGYVAVEFAGIFHGLGVETHLIYRGSPLLRGFDEDIRNCLTTAMRDRGIHLHLDSDLLGIERDGATYRVRTSGGEVVEGELLLHATGRKPNVTGLGLEEVGVPLNHKGAIVVDQHLRTEVPNVFAVGDVIGRVPLTPVALAEGTAVARTLFEGGAPIHPDYHNIPTAVFSQPEIASVGYTEHLAREQFREVKVFRSLFRPLKLTMTRRSEKTLMKLLVDADTDRVVGCHMVGPHAGEIIQGLAVAVKSGAKKAHFDSTIGIHPTSAEEFVTMREPVT